MPRCGKIERGTTSSSSSSLPSLDFPRSSSSAAAIGGGSVVRKMPTEASLDRYVSQLQSKKKKSPK